MYFAYFLRSFSCLNCTSPSPGWREKELGWKGKERGDSLVGMLSQEYTPIYTNIHSFIRQRSLKVEGLRKEVVRFMGVDEEGKGRLESGFLI